MFKPEYILDDVAVFGLTATIVMVRKKFQRLGKSYYVADSMAYKLVMATVYPK